MKKLILILMLATAAHADTVATAQNNGGGLLVLTDIKCKDKKSMVAYSTLPNARTGVGCWFIDDNFVFILWDDNDLRTYPFEIWDTKRKGKTL